jgi:hypothetical protein
MHRTMQRGRAGSKQRAAQACQQSNREPELCFLFQRSVSSVSVQFAPTSGHSTLRCQALKPDTAFRPLPPYQDFYSKSWLLLVTTPPGHRGNTLIGGMWGAILRVWLDAGYVPRGEAFSLTELKKIRPGPHKMTQISAEKGHRWPVSSRLRSLRKWLWSTGCPWGRLRRNSARNRIPGCRHHPSKPPAARASAPGRWDAC